MALIRIFNCLPDVEGGRKLIEIFLGEKYNQFYEVDVRIDLFYMFVYLFIDFLSYVFISSS